MDAIEIEKLTNGNTIEIHIDEHPESPREWDNLGSMICWHRNYSLGDSEHPEKWETPADFIKWATRNRVAYLPLYLYDHSGITMNTTGFSCPWDSGQVGYIYVTTEKMREEYNCKAVSKKLRERVLGYLKNEVETYDQYLTGSVYGYIIKDEKDEEIDSCWGFYGTTQECLKEAKANVQG